MNKIFKLIVVSFALLIMASCQLQNNNKDKEKHETPVETFIEKIQDGHYSIGMTGWRTSKVYSNDLVVVDYDDPTYDDDVYMTVNNNETYTAPIIDNVLDEQYITYFGEGHACDVVNTLLPNYWLLLVGDNIWDIFTSYGDNPLLYKIINSTIISQVASIYGNMRQSDIGFIEETHLILADEDVTSAIVCLKFYEEYGEDDMIIDIKFNVNKPSSFPTDSWMDNPNRSYPEKPTDWTDEDVTAFCSLFGQDYRESMSDVVPFPDYATVTFKRDGTSTFLNNEFIVRDTRATEEDLEAYANKLVNDYGYDIYEEELSDGSKINRYDLLVGMYKENHFFYVSIYLEYDNGITLLLQQNFNFIRYTGRNTINALIAGYHFPALPASSELTKFDSIDMVYPQTLGINYFVKYELALEVSIQYLDVFEAMEYMDAYVGILQDNGFFLDESSGLSHSTLETESFKSTFEYTIDTANKQILIMYRNNTYYEDDVANEIITSMGFPSIHLENFVSSARDLTLFYQYQYGVTNERVLQADVQFTSPESKVEFYVDFEAALNELGFVEVDPIMVQVPYKNKGYYNSALGLVVAYNEDYESIASLHFIKKNK